MLNLTLPELDDFYADLVKRPNVLRVVTLSGGTAGIYEGSLTCISP